MNAGKDALANLRAMSFSARMSTGLVPLRQKNASRQPRARSVKSRNTASRTVKLHLDAKELALHAAISAAVARDLGR
jgi:hypothetical protein